MNYRTNRLTTLYALLFLIPAILPVYAHAFYRPHYISLETGIYAGFSALFGPWATLIAKFTEVPNAGDLFYLPIALILTIGLLTPIFISIRVKKRWLAVICLGLFVPQSLFWLILGFGQIENCIR